MEERAVSSPNGEGENNSSHQTRGEEGENNNCSLQTRSVGSKYTKRMCLNAFLVY